MKSRALYTLATLGQEGMSGDESEPAGSPNVKRCRIPWISDDITRFWDLLDGKEQVQQEQTIVNGRRHRGNRAKITLSGSVLSHRPAMRGLPRNWYNSAWWNTLSSATQFELDAREPVELPTFVSLCRMLLVSLLMSLKRDRMTWSGVEKYTLEALLGYFYIRDVFLTINVLVFHDAASEVEQ